MPSPPDWVQTQHRTMIRWINAKLNTELSDLTSELLDGVILIRLINKIIEESDDDNVSYVLTPMYTKPNFKLQKLENVEDFLKFCQIMLKINLCSISAENIVEGNLKLILGLIWSLFIYSTSNTLRSMKNESTSLVEIKSILMVWCNKLIHTRALPAISNFNKDWSLDVNRPDLIFGCILDYYLPTSVNYNALVLGKKSSNLSLVLRTAESLGIPQLADLEDFNLFVPDEKSIIFYVLEWYKFFELNHFHESAAVSVAPASVDYKAIMDGILHTLKLKHKYETRALRLANHLNTDILKHSTYNQYDTEDELINNINIFLNKLNKAFDDDALVNSEEDNFMNVMQYLNRLLSYLYEMETFKNETKPAYMYSDIPELKKLFKSICTNLDAIGITESYQPPKSLDLQTLKEKFDSLSKLQMETMTKLLSIVDNLIENSIMGGDFNTYLVIMHQNLQNSSLSEKSDASDYFLDYISKLEYLIDATHKLSYFKKNLNLQNSPGELKTLVHSLENPLHDCSPLKTEFGNSPLVNLKQKTFGVIDDYNLDRSGVSFTNCKKVVGALLEETDVLFANNFAQIVTNRVLAFNRSESDFNIHYASDESDDSNSLFDGLQKKVGEQLMGNCNKVYDFADFFDKLENGFKI